jgi:hypothetical protein
MTNPNDNAAALSRTTVRIPTASGVRVELEFLHRHAKTRSRISESDDYGISRTDAIATDPLSL